MKAKFALAAAMSIALVGQLGVTQAFAQAKTQLTVYTAVVADDLQKY